MSSEHFEKTNSPKIGVLLMAYGSPHKPEDVREFYTDIRKGRVPSDELIQEIESRYREIGGETPFNTITHEQARSVEESLDSRAPGTYYVYVGMKHWKPRIVETIEVMKRDGVEKIIALVLAPHYSKISIGEYREKVEEACEKLDYHPELRFINNWHTNEDFITCISEQLGEDPGLVIFTSHSIPERIIESGDPYKDQLLETCALIAEKRDQPLHFEFAFQSAGRTPEPWLGPDVRTVLERLAEEGHTQITICPIGFTADNLEIVYDIDTLLMKRAEELGVRLSRAPSRNTHPHFINAVVSEIVGAS